VFYLADLDLIAVNGIRDSDRIAGSIDKAGFAVIGEVLGTVRYWATTNAYIWCTEIVFT